MFVPGEKQYWAYATLALGSAMALFMYPHAITAVLSSAHAVLRNKGALATWAACIVAITAFGLATGFVGFIWDMPWLAYSAWHAYRATLVTDQWPAQ